MKIPLTKPYIPEGSFERVEAVLRSGWLTEGNVVLEFEGAFRDYYEMNYAVMVPNATIGIEIALRKAGIGVGDKVLVPNFTHPATALAVLNTSAEPILCDVDEQTFNMEIPVGHGHLFDAIVPVSQFGNPVDYDRILDYFHDKEMPIIVEDAACSFGSALVEKTLVDAYVFSFHPRKVLTCGEGGVILTNSRDLFEELVQYKNFGEFVNPSGNNCKVSDILAAVVLGQLSSFDEILEKRNRLAQKYLWELRSLPLGFQRVPFPSNYQTFCVVTDRREELRHHLEMAGVSTQIGTHALSELPQFDGLRKIGHLPVSKQLAKSVMALPLYHEMTAEEQDYVIAKIKEFFN